MAVSQSIHPAMTLRHREASSLLQMLLSPLLCGSWLASDGGGSVNTPGNDIAPSRASSLPQMPLSTCGSWLASDGGGSVNTSCNDIAPSRASSLLQGVGGMQINRLPQMPLSPCGSWLASDGGGSVNTSGNDTAPSRGKLAPTVEWVVCRRWRCVSHQPQSPNAVPSRRGSAPAAQPF